MSDKTEFGGSIGNPSEITVNEDGSVTEIIARYLDGSSIVKVTNLDGSECTTTCTAPTNNGGLGVIGNPKIAKCSSEFQRYWCENLGMCVSGKEECPDYIISPVEVGGPLETISPVRGPANPATPVDFNLVKTGLFIKDPRGKIESEWWTTSPVTPTTPATPPIATGTFYKRDPIYGKIGGPLEKLSPVGPTKVPVKMVPIATTNPIKSGDMMITRNTLIEGMTKLSEFVPQAVGDATITTTPGGVTGKVEITKYYPFKSQALDDERSTLKYVSGSITGSIPIDKKEMMVFHNVI